MSSDQGSKERGRGAALVVVALLLALGAVALLAPDGDDAPGGGKVAVVTTGSGAPAAAGKVELGPGGATTSAGPRVLPLGDGPVGGEVVLGGPGPEGVVVDARRAAPADDATVRATGLRGRVVTTAGAPVAGARVSLRGNRPDAAGMTIMKFEPNAQGEMELSSPGELRPPEVTTDADGVFVCAGLDPSFRFTLHARPADDQDLLPAKRPAPALRPGQLVDVGDVRLARGARLSGTVYDAEGRPLPDATVRLGGEDGVFTFGGGEEGGDAPTGGIAVRKSFRVAAPAAPAGDDGPGVVEGPMMPGMGGPSARTDAAGRYTLPRVRPGKHVVTATKPGLRSARVDVELREGQAKDDLDLRLAAGLGVTVEAVDAQGQSIAGATVQVTSGFGPGGGGKAQKTDAQGRARFDGLSSAEVTIAARAEGFASVVQEVLLGPSDPDTPRRLTLLSGATVTGRLVRDSDGSPVTRGFVMLEPLVHGPDVNVSADGSNRPDAEGRFRLTGVAAGRYRLRAMSAELAPAEVEVSVAGATTDVGEVRLGALAALDVLVLDPDGAPVADARVDAGQGEGGMMVAIVAGTSDGKGDEPPIMHGGAAGRSGPDGRVRLERLQPGALSVRATKPPFADGWGEATATAATPGEVTVRLARPARIDGRLVGAEPGARARVSLLRRGRRAPIGTAEVVEGAFAFERVSPGEYRLTPSGVQSSGPEEWFTVAEGESVSRTVEAAPTATVSGVVRAADGTVVTGAAVVAGWLDAWHAGDAQVRFPMARATTDVAGRYELKGVLPQPGLGLMVTTAQGVRTSFRLEVPGPTRVHRDLRLPAAGEQGATLRVRAVTSEGAAAGARVTLERADDGPHLRREAAAGPDGVASFEGVPAGGFIVSAVAPGRARSRAAVEVGSGAAEVEGPTLALDAGGALLLEVVGAPGAVGEANLTIRREGSTSFDDTWFTGVDLGGRARIDGLELGGRYEVTATAKGHREARVTLSCDGVDPQAPATVRLEPAQ